MSTIEREMMHEAERIADGHGCVVFVTTRDDDPDQPEAFGVWGGPGGAGGVDLLDCGPVLTEALAGAIATMRGWE